MTVDVEKTETDGHFEFVIFLSSPNNNFGVCISNAAVIHGLLCFTLQLSCCLAR